MKAIISIALAAALSGCATTYQTAEGPLKCPLFGSDNPKANVACFRAEMASYGASELEAADAYARSIVMDNQQKGPFPRYEKRACDVYAHLVRDYLGRGDFVYSTYNRVPHVSVAVDNSALDVNFGVIPKDDLCRVVWCEGE